MGNSMTDVGKFRNTVTSKFLEQSLQNSHPLQACWFHLFVDCPCSPIICDHVVAKFGLAGSKGVSITNHLRTTFCSSSICNTKADRPLRYLRFPAFRCSIWRERNSRLSKNEKSSWQVSSERNHFSNQDKNYVHECECGFIYLIPILPLGMFLRLLKQEFKR